MKPRPTPPLAPARLPSTTPPHPGAEAAARAPRVERDTPNVELRLSIGRGGIGFELARPAELFGLATVSTLDLRLPGMRFPLDVSGGVARFRHRRGELVALTVEIERHRAMRWAASQLRGIVSLQAPELWVRARAGAATIALVEPERAETATTTPAKILAFELVLLPDDRDLRLVVTHARGTGLAGPPTALALAAAGKLLQTTAARASRHGALFTLPDALGRLVRSLLPEAGIRSPSTQGARWSGTAAVDDTWILQASADGVTIEPSEQAVRAAEVARLARAADDARAAGDLVQARALDLVTLGGAARHPEIARRVAEIDHAAGGRAEAALSLLRDIERDRTLARRTTTAPASATTTDAARGTEGTLRAELLEATGDLDGARAAYVRAGETEEVPALAAEAFLRAASLLRDPFDALVWLDRAVAERPESARLRWARVDRRLAAGRLDEARADVESIAAASGGADAKELGVVTYSIWRRAGDAWRDRGLRAEASALYERALRAAPDDPSALAGLGMALAEGGRAARGATLLSRSIEIGEGRGEDTAASELALAVILAEKLSDLPAAASRARVVPASAACAPEARGLEGRWRAQLGDRIGASLAFARLREAAETADLRGDVILAPVVALLQEAASFERDVRGDLASAQRHLGAALALVPGDADVARRYRAIGAELAPKAAPPVREEPVSAPAPAPALADVADLPEAAFDEATASARVDDLIAQLRARPEDDAVVDELARLLTALDRAFELLALLSARLEDAPADVRARLLPRQRTVLARLAEDADREGRPAEAAIFRDALEMLEG